ncbi:exonuclease domain-containing protein [Demequina sp. SYSU T00068]|uniref:exonuclease domain-containing protein n=1 Tax=Demequina lignilytica TaxID=3051663 RepID=UPI002631115E|nr:exonuclease domain-containing protein [Demequina sp. SYSU T00068]MDN4489679.1 exonuclease domain-containing protein [Demequina sp. SYSU T00068]
MAFDWIRRNRRSSDMPETELQKRPTSVRVGAPAYSIVDVETTGLSARRDRIIEIAVIRVDGNGLVVDEWSTRINPGVPIDPRASAVHGITDADVRHAPDFRQVFPEFASRVQGTEMVAHNITFDASFLAEEILRLDPNADVSGTGYCTLVLARAHNFDVPNYRLSTCAEAVGHRHDGAHSALGDARATVALWRAVRHLADETTEFDWGAAHRKQRHAASRPTPVDPHVHARRAKNIAARRAQLETATPLYSRLSRSLVAEALDEGAPETCLPYLQTLCDALADGVIDADEAQALTELIDTQEMTPDDVAACHGAVMRAMTFLALEDGVVSRDERAELADIAELLGVTKASVKRLLDSALEARHRAMGENLRPLPADWVLGEPLHVGDKVVFTGCDDHERDHLERRAKDSGVRVIGSVSRLTCMLITDDSFHGTKDARARELGLRRVAPGEFAIMLDYLQPAVPPPTARPARAR